MMDYYVQPWHLYSHSRICTRSGLCRILSRLVEFSTSLIVPVFMRFQLSWIDFSVCQISSSIMEILIHCISSSFIDILILCIYSSGRFWSIIYCMWQWPYMSYFVSCLFMAIVLLCIRDCYMYLHSHAEIDHCIVLMSGWFFQMGLHYSTYGIDYIMYFVHHVMPLTSHFRGNLL